MVSKNKKGKESESNTGSRKENDTAGQSKTVFLFCFGYFGFFIFGKPRPRQVLIRFTCYAVLVGCFFLVLKLRIFFLFFSLLFVSTKTCVEDLPMAKKSREN